MDLILKYPKYKSKEKKKKFRIHKKKTWQNDIAGKIIVTLFLILSISCNAVLINKYIYFDTTSIINPIDYDSNDLTWTNYTIIDKLRVHSSEIICLLELNNGDIASGLRDKTIMIWKFRGQEITFYRLNDHTDMITSLIELNHGYLASGSRDTTIIVWNLNKKEPKYKLTGHKDGIRCLELLPNKSSELLSASSDGNIIIWNLKSGIDVHRINTSYLIWSIKLIPDERNLILIGTNIGDIVVFDLKRKSAIYKLVGERCRVNSIVLFNDDLVASSHNSTITIWNLSTRSKVYKLEGHSREISSLALLKNGYLASGSMDKSIKIWDLDNKELKLNLIEHENRVFSLLVLKNGLLLSGGLDDLIIIWKPL